MIEFLNRIIYGSSETEQDIYQHELSQHVTDQFLLAVYIFRKTVTIHIPSWMVCYYVAEDTRSIEHPYSRLFSVPVEARRTMTAGASSLLMTVEYIITRKKKAHWTRDLIVRPGLL